MRYDVAVVAKILGERRDPVHCIGYLVALSGNSSLVQNVRGALFTHVCNNVYDSFEWLSDVVACHSPVPQRTPLKQALPIRLSWQVVLDNSTLAVRINTALQ